MSVPPSQSTDFFKFNMQEHDREAFSIHTSTAEVVKTNIDENSGLRPPSAPPQSKPMESGTEPPPPLPKPPPASSESNKPQKVSGTGPPPSSPKNTDVGSSSETSSVLKDYEKLQSVLDELDDEEKELRQQIMKDAKAHLETTDYCLFEQLPPFWKQTTKYGENVRFQTLGHKGDPIRVYKFPQSEKKELINALGTLNRDTYGCGAERRPRITDMDKEIHEILAEPINNRPDWEAIYLDQFGRKISFLAIKQRSRTDTDDILETKLPAWINSYFDTIIRNYSEVTDGAPTCFREYKEQVEGINPSELEPVSDFLTRTLLIVYLRNAQTSSHLGAVPTTLFNNWGNLPQAKRSLDSWLRATNQRSSTKDLSFQ
ncbi:hypothetical protein P9112_004080 [Eukaryota sp. TZLM1-RC]